MRNKLSVLAIVLMSSGVVASDPWAPPAGFYQNITGTGSSLQSALRSRMSSGHIQRRYGDFRQSASLHDADPNRPGNILLAYNRQSVSGTWTSGATWNREHVWPQSRQPGSASNSTRGNLGDPHALRPCNPGINSSRSNKPFGFENTTGSGRSVGSYWFPGDADKGDIARMCFYSNTRYGLSLVNGFPSGNSMGGLDSMVAWHYSDIPDTFERRRNHVIYSSAENPSYFTGNRNAFVDLPGAVWSVYVDNFNGAQLWVGNQPANDGGSSIVVDFGNAIIGYVPQTTQVTLNRAGFHGVYYAVTSEGLAVTDQPLTNGFTDAFAINDAAPRMIMVGLDVDASSTAGSYAGSVRIDNLDFTNGLGPGFGANDADDIVMLELELYDSARASFSPSTQDDAIVVDLGEVVPGETVEVDVPLYALEQTPGFTAGAVLALVQATGDTSEITLTIPDGVVPAGLAANAVISATPDSSGDLTATFTLGAADDPSINGAAAQNVLTLTVTGTLQFCLGDSNGDRQINGVDIGALVNGFYSQQGDPFFNAALDFNADGQIDGIDLGPFVNAWLSGACQ